MQIVLNPETVSVIVSVPRAIRFGLFVLLAHFAQRRRKSSPILFCGTSIWMVPFVVFSRLTTMYPSAVVVWLVRSPAAEMVIFPERWGRPFSFRGNDGDDPFRSGDHEIVERKKR